jgi:hypothetical protein
MGVSSIDTPFLNKIEKLNSGTNAYKEFKLKSANASEFFGLAKKTGVTTRMFGRNSIWGRITAYFGFDTTYNVNEEVNKKVRDELKKNVTKIINDEKVFDKLRKETLIESLNKDIDITPICDDHGIHLTPEMVMKFAKEKKDFLNTRINVPSISPNSVLNNSKSS